MCLLPDVVLQFAGYEGKDEGQQSQQDVIGEDAADEDHGAFIALEDDLYILGRSVLDRVRREDDEPHCARYSLGRRMRVSVILHNLVLQPLRGQNEMQVTCINVAAAAIALWWAQVRVSTSGLAQALASMLLFVLVTMTSGLPLLAAASAAASAAAFAALAAALLLTRAAFRA